VFVGARMTAEPTFHSLCLKVEVSLLYSTHHALTHNRLLHHVSHQLIYLIVTQIQTISILIIKTL
ncbi:MAG: hypothetical protein DCF22_22045, partial [Leptolyngbya sp.]